MSYQAPTTSVVGKKMSNGQRKAMIDALLAGSPQKRFKPETLPSLDLSSSSIDQHFRYFRRLNGMESITDQPQNPAIFLPRWQLDPREEQIACDQGEEYLFEQLLHRFFAQKSDEDSRDLFIHNVDHFMFYLLDYLFSSNPINIGQLTKNRLVTIAMDLHAVSQRFTAAVSSVSFDALEHKYYVDGQQMDLSVTQSLDQLFGTFNEDEAAVRMIQSRNWQRNALFKAINYDESGNQRDQQTMQSLIKKEWRTRCNRGTVLHEYINRSLTAGGTLILDSGASGLSDSVVNCIDQSARAQQSDDVVSDQNEIPPQLVESLPIDRVNDDTPELFDQPKIAAKKEDMNETIWSQALALWIEYRGFFSQRSKIGALAANHRPRGDNGSIASIDLLDNANVSAFSIWNRCRLDDHWLLLASEYTVYDQQAGLAGTIDCIFMPYPHQPNMVVLVDWKRCEIDFGTRYYGLKDRYKHQYVYRYPKCNYWKYAFQLNLYREMLERAHNGRLIVIDMIIVNFMPDSRFPRTFSVPRIAETRLFLDDLRAAKNKSESV